MLVHGEVVAMPVLMAFIQVLKLLERNARTSYCRPCQCRETSRKVREVIIDSGLSGLDSS